MRFVCLSTYFYSILIQLYIHIHKSICFPRRQETCSLNPNGAKFLIFSIYKIIAMFLFATIRRNLSCSLAVDDSHI